MMWLPYEQRRTPLKGKIRISAGGGGGIAQLRPFIPSRVCVSAFKRKAALMDVKRKKQQDARREAKAARAQTRLDNERGRFLVASFDAYRS